METKVKFNRKKTKEQALLGNSGTIYFTTDKSIVLDGESYGGEQEVTLKDTPSGVAPDVEYVSKVDVTTLLNKKLDKSLLTTSTNFTVKSGKEYYLGTISGETIILSEEGLITNEVPDWHFYFTAGTDAPGWSDGTSPIEITWASDPDFTEGSLCECDILKITLEEDNIIYTGFISTREI